MAGTGSISRLLRGLHSGGGFRLAQPRARVWSPGGVADCDNPGSDHAGWAPGLADAVRTVSGCDLPGEDLGGSLPWADASEASRSDEGRLGAGITGGAADP